MTVTKREREEMNEGERGSRMVESGMWIRKEEEAAAERKNCSSRDKLQSC